MKCDNVRQAMLLYAVTDQAWVGRQSLYEQVECALQGGATCIQLREKDLDDPAFLDEALSHQPLCRTYGVPLIINDNVTVALQSGARRHSRGTARPRRRGRCAVRQAMKSS